MARRRKFTNTLRKVFGRKKSLREKLIQFFKTNKITARNEQMQMILEIMELHETRAADVKTAIDIVRFNKYEYSIKRIKKGID